MVGNILKILGISAILIVGYCMIHTRPYDNASICYMPFDIETYAATTREIFEKNCFLPSGFNTDDRSFQKLMAIISVSPEGEFNENHHRVKIRVIEGNVIYMDRYGGVRVEGQPDRKIDETDVSETERYVHDLDRSCYFPCCCR